MTNIYIQAETDYYCNSASHLKSPNTSSFATLKTYASNADARMRHKRDIPWLADIRAPITTSSGAVNGLRLELGTPVTLAGTEPGLFSGSNCSRKLPSFRPYGIDTIMKSLSTTWIPPIHRKAVLAAIAKAAGL